MSERYTSLEKHSDVNEDTKMADRSLNRLGLLDNIPRHNRNLRREYNFDYDQYDEDQFRSRYRLTKDGFRALLEIIYPSIAPHNDRGKPIPADIQLLLALRFYATGTFQLACGDLTYISQPSASRIIKRVSEAIARLKNNYIAFPEGELLNDTKRDFWRIGEFPGVVGAIDCTHIKIVCPGGDNAELFRNRKGFFSINVQVVCGPNLEIQNIVARWPGSVHDARVLDNSRLCARFERGDISGVLLGDSGYACRQYLMTPIVDPQTRPERMYKRMFGLWKRMFPCLSQTLRTNLETTLTMVIATAVLYNFVRVRHDPLDEPHNPPVENVVHHDAAAGER